MISSFFFIELIVYKRDEERGMQFGGLAVYCDRKEIEEICRMSELNPDESL